MSYRCAPRCSNPFRLTTATPLFAVLLLLGSLGAACSRSDEMPVAELTGPERVAAFLDDYGSLTFELNDADRNAKLDERIAEAGLTLEDKIEAFRGLSPRATEGISLDAATIGRNELRMQRLILSVAATDLPSFKAALEYDGDYKDLEEYLFHDIDSEEIRAPILEHLAHAPASGVKVLTDVDDTMFANLVDNRYPKKQAPYPGVLTFYESLGAEPVDVGGVAVTTLSARPNPAAGILEEDSISGLQEFTAGRLKPSGLSGDLVSSTIGTIETLARDRLGKDVPSGQEEQIGVVKFLNFSRFAQVYPEYDYAFVGDSGQADALTAVMMLTEDSYEGTARVRATFIHDLRESADDREAASPSFLAMETAGHGVIVFRNYIDAAVQAHAAAADLLSAQELATITQAALEEFGEFDFGDKAASRTRLAAQYQEDAERALEGLAEAAAGDEALAAGIQEIRQLQDGL